VIYRQARHTRSSWVSSHASGGAAPVDWCTERRWDTKNCRQLRPVGETPSRRAHRAMGQNHIPEGWVEAVVRGRGRGVLGWDGSLACPSGEGSYIYMGPVAAGSASRASTRVSSCNGSESVSIGAPGGARGASPVIPCTSPCAGPGSVAADVTGGSRGAGLSGGGGGPACAGASELNCAASRGWKRDRRVAAGGPSEEGRGLVADRVVDARPSGPAGWKRCTSRLRSTFPRRLPRGSVSVWRCAARSCASGSGGGGGAVGATAHATAGGGYTLAAACLRHQFRDYRVVFLPQVRGRWAWVGLHVPTRKEGNPPPGGQWGQPREPFRGRLPCAWKTPGLACLSRGLPPTPAPDARAHVNEYSDVMREQSGKGQGHCFGHNGCWGGIWAPPGVWGDRGLLRPPRSVFGAGQWWGHFGGLRRLPRGRARGRAVVGPLRRLPPPARALDRGRAVTGPIRGPQPPALGPLRGQSGAGLRCQGG